MAEDQSPPYVCNVLPPTKIKSLVRSWLEEDCPGFDIGGSILGQKEGVTRLLCKSPCVLAGVPFFNEIFEELNCQVIWIYPEGQAFSKTSKSEGFQPIHVATVRGLTKNILLGERPALNVLSRASGIATLCQKYVEKAKAHGWNGRIAGTRKTTPGFRAVEKYALLVGGADAHRYDLSSMVMLKDNHVWSTGNIRQTVQKALELTSFATKVEVECRSIDEGLEAADAGAHIVMFDNQTPECLHKAARQLKEKFPHIIVECSGGITEENISEYFGKDVDIISTSKLVQGYPCADFSLKIFRDA